jgi:Domain of unknown function (DUF4382)/Domain of unknown function (DUF5666)
MKKFASLVVLLAPMFLLLACGGAGSGTTPPPNNQQGAVFVLGEDAPVSSVVAFNITINSISLNNSSTSVQALSTPTAVDFGRLMGLRSLLAFNTVPQGTYNSVTFTFEASNPAPVISYVDFNPSPACVNPPCVQPLTGALTSATVTVPFPAGKPLTVGANGLAGLHIDFDLRDSLAVDSNNDITGVISPVIAVQAVSASEELGEITEFTGNVVSVNVAANSFVMQGPYGFQRTIDVNANTQYNGTNSLSTLVVDGIVSVIGRMQADGSILAAGVELISTDKAFISGRILAVNPTSGPVQTVTMWVGEELGTSGIIRVDTVVTIDLSAVSRYDICFFDNILTQQLFNDSSLVVGQRIFIGGIVSGGVFTPKMVSLRRQGVVGVLVANSVTVTGGTGSNQGSFQMQNDALMSYAAGGPFTVLAGDKTFFVNIDGLAGMAQAGTPNLLVRGLVFKNPSDGKPVVVAGRVRVLP